MSMTPIPIPSALRVPPSDASSAIPRRHTIPAFPPIRRGSGGRHRLQQAVRHRRGMLTAGVVAAATALAAGPLRSGPPHPAVTATAEAVSPARCTGTSPPVR